MEQNKAYAIRTCDKDMKAYGGFVWPSEIGAEVVAPDWQASNECGNGLHALIDGIGDYSLLSNAADAVWQIVEVERAECVLLGGKVKFPKCKIVYSGDMATAMTMISKEWVRIALAETNGAATSGYGSHSATTGSWAHSATSGEGSHSATTGEGSHSATTGYGSHSATSGEGSHSATTGSWAHSATSGERTISASLGNNGKAKAGKNGVVIVAYYDEKNKRPRVCVGCVGEKGIKADTWYCVVKNKLQEAA